MKKRLLYLSATVIIFSVFLFSVNAQEGVKIRVGVNSGMFFSEPGSSDAIVDPLAVIRSTPGGTSDFSTDIKFGLEAEISIPVGEFLGIGVEFEDSKYGGTNDNPIYYNYFTSPYSPTLDYEQEPLLYNTSVTNILGTFRVFPLGHNRMTPFLKLYGGVAFIGTDLRYALVEDQTQKTDPLYSRGTKLSIVEPSKYKAPHFGAGAGFEYMISENISMVADFNFSYIGSDIIDGVPNFTFDNTRGYSVYHDISTITGQLSVGVCYTLGSTGISSSKSSGRSSGGKTDGFLPFFRRK